MSYRYEIIYVNDCSPDGATAILDEIAEASPEVTVIHHSRNFGKMAAIDTGFRQAMGDAVVYMDGDLQDPPELIVEFLQLWQQGNLVVFGKIRSRKGSRLIGCLSSIFYWFWNKTTEFDLPHGGGDFCLLDRKVVDVMNSLPEKDRFFRGLRSWVGFPQAYVALDRPARHAGASTQSLLSYFSWAGLAITSFSFWPLRMISFVAVGSVALLLGYFIMVSAMFFVGIETPRGFMTIIGLIILVSSINLICLAVIAEYLTRIFIEVKGRPSAILHSVRNNHRS